MLKKNEQLRMNKLKKMNAQKKRSFQHKQLYSVRQIKQLTECAGNKKAGSKLKDVTYSPAKMKKL